MLLCIEFILHRVDLYSKSYNISWFVLSALEINGLGHNTFVTRHTYLLYKP